MSAAITKSLNLAPVGDQQSPGTPKPDSLCGLENQSAVRVANPVDTTVIAEIAQACSIDRVEDPNGGYLRFVPDADQVHRGMRENEYLLQERLLGKKAMSFLRIGPPASMYHAPHEHVMFPEYRERLAAIFESNAYSYVATLATDPAERGSTSKLEKDMLRRFPGLPMFAHVAVFDEEDYRGWDGNPESFAPAHNNIASHKFHQKHGWVPVGYICDIPNCAFNTGMPVPKDGGCCAVLYANFGEPVPDPPPFIDPVRAVLDAPRPEHRLPPVEHIAPEAPDRVKLLDIIKCFGLRRHLQQELRRSREGSDPWRFVSDDET